MFQVIAQEKSEITRQDFKREFSNIHFTGKQVIGKQFDTVNTRVEVGNSLTSKWETDVLDKLRRLIRSSGKNLDQIFSQFDFDSSGTINMAEFHKAMKLVSLGLTDIEIKKIAQRIDANNDGIISYEEFASKFRDYPEYDKRMKTRAVNRIAKLKQQMCWFMTSSVEAFKMVSDKFC